MNTPAMRPQRRRILITAALFLFASALYAPSLRGGFVWDDRPLILTDRRIRSVRLWPSLLTTAFFTPQNTGREASYYRPLISLTYALDYRLAGGATRPWVYHLHNILAYAACCVLVLLLLRRLVPRPAAAAPLAAFAFAAHLLHTESVAWISGRTDVYAAILMIAAWLVHTGGAGRWRPWLVALLAFLGLMAKEVALVLVPLLFVTDWTRSGSLGRTARALPRLVPAALVTIGYVLLRRHALHGMTTGLEGRHFDPLSLSGLATVCYTTLAYIGRLIAPVWSSAEFEIVPFRTAAGAVPVLSILAVAALGALTVLALFRAPRAGLGLVWFGFTLAPAVNLIPIAETAAERFAFIPGIGAALLLALLFERALRPGGGARARRRLVAASAAVLVLSMAASVLLRIPDWRTERTLCIHNVRTAPDNPRAHLGLASIYQAEDQLPGLAETHLRWAVELSPTMAAAHNNLGKILQHRGSPLLALRHLLTAAAISPRDAIFLCNIAETLILLADGHPDRAGLWTRARRRIDRALRINPRYADAHYLSALWLLKRTSETDRALAELETAVRLDPAFAEAWYLRGVALQRLGRKGHAAESYRHALQLNPGFPEARRALDALAP
jgi:Tfp pilus assembly protein PilF